MLKTQRELAESDYFGEISIIFGSSRTAEVQSVTHCTLAYLSYQHFKNILDYNPDLMYNLRDRALDYVDDWIDFKVFLLKQIDYFNDVIIPGPMDDIFYKQVQFHMEESIYQKGSEIIASGDKCGSLVFIVNGLVDIEVYDEQGNAHRLA